MIAASVFAGCGGSSLGYRRAGIRVAYACEWDDLAAETYELNLGAAVDRRDVQSVRGEEMLAAAGGEVDLLDLSPPCQAWSVLGHRDPGDARGEPMLAEAARLVREARPRAAVVENVVGLAQGRARWALLQFAKDLRGAGYAVACRELRASRLGVPQLRPRIFLVALRRDLGADPRGAFPRPARREAAVRDALPGVGRVVVLDRPGARPPWNRGSEWSASGPAPTVTASGMWRVSREFVRLEDEEGGLRRPTIGEVAALCGFPPDYCWPERAGEAARWRMLGNAVPPPVAEAVGRAVRRALEGG